MPSLREILEQQKQQKGLTNGQDIPSSKPSKVEAVDASKGETQNNVSENRSGEIEGTIAGNGSDGGQAHVAILPERLEPPAGLSGVQLMLWKRKNPGYVPLEKLQSTNLPASGKEIVSENVEKQGDNVSTNADTSQLLSGNSAGNAGASTSASQSADTTKTNDGNVDAEALRKNLIYLANNIDQKELVAQVIRTIAVQLKNTPTLMAHMQHADMDLLVRGMRRSYAIVARKKSEVRETKQAKSAVEQELQDAFKGAGLDAGLGGFKLSLKP